MTRKKNELPKLANFFEIQREFKKESDRGIALILTAWLGDALDAYLRSRVVDNTKAIQKLFDGDRPLSTFSARINVAYLFGLIGAKQYADLHSIREIRNDFAHDREAISFKTQSISDRCKNLNAYKIDQETETDPRLRRKSPRYAFMLATTLYTASFMTASRTAQRPVWSEDDEDRYFNAAAEAIASTPNKLPL
jgi:DNA-binding MltR family transcriptional regulator